VVRVPPSPVRELPHRMHEGAEGAIKRGDLTAMDKICLVVLSVDSIHSSGVNPCSDKVANTHVFTACLEGRHA